ncbi:MAG: hypothetical protein KDA87_24170, partial [Planctomycetales bacterium]|nr:hypothetical protein [Planctomycetales bacterium]
VFRAVGGRVSATGTSQIGVARSTVLADREVVYVAIREGSGDTTNVVGNRTSVVEIEGNTPTTPATAESTTNRREGDLHIQRYDDQGAAFFVLESGVWSLRTTVNKPAGTSVVFNVLDVAAPTTPPASPPTGTIPAGSYQNDGVALRLIYSDGFVDEYERIVGNFVFRDRTVGRQRQIVYENVAAATPETPPLTDNGSTVTGPIVGDVLKKVYADGTVLEYQFTGTTFAHRATYRQQGLATFGNLLADRPTLTAVNVGHRFHHSKNGLWYVWNGAGWDVESTLAHLDHLPDPENDQPEEGQRVFMTREQRTYLYLARTGWVREDSVWWELAGDDATAGWTIKQEKFVGLTTMTLSFAPIRDSHVMFDVSVYDAPDLAEGPDFSVSGSTVYLKGAIAAAITPTDVVTVTYYAA